MSTQPRESPHARRPPRVWWLFALVIPLAIGLGWFTAWPRKQHRAVEATRTAGGFATFGDQHVPVAEGLAPRPTSRMTRLLERIGPEYARDLTLISLDARPVTEA